MNVSWKVGVLLVVTLAVTANFIAAIWLQVEFLFAGTLPVTDLHPTLAGGGFLSLEHLFFHLWQIVRFSGLVGIVVAVTELFVWLETGMQELKTVWQKETTFLQVGHKRVRQR